MKKIFVYPILMLFKFINYSISMFYLHAIPKDLKKRYNQAETRRRSIIRAYDLFSEEEIRESYNHFKKYFYTSLLVKTRHVSREYAIKKALENHEENDFYLEFGVFQGTSINQSSKILKDKIIYGFDSFEGLHDDWKGDAWPNGYFNLNKKIPKLNNNVKLEVGLVQKTLPEFLSKHKNLLVNYIHLDLDTYPSTKFVLNLIKPYLKDKCILIFDELYDFPGWKVGEYKALTEEFNEDEYEYLCFSREGKGSVVIKYNKK